MIEREREEQCHQRAQAGDREASPPAFGLEPHHHREPAHDDDPGGDGARTDQAEVKAVAREQVAGDDTDPDRQAGGNREACDRLEVAVGPPRPRARREREHEGGDADRHRGGDRELPREQREDPGRDRDRPADRGGEHGLGDEQPRDPLDVSQDLATFADHPGHDAEVVADEHEIGDRARHLRSGALGDRQPCLLERRDVVDPVAEHRHVAPGVGERGDDRALALGRDPPDGGRGQDGLAAAPPDRWGAPRRRAPAPTRARRRRERSPRRWPARRRRAPSARPPAR